MTNLSKTQCLGWEAIGFAKLALLLCFLVCLPAMSLRYHNEFKNPPKNAPHAVLRGTKYPKRGHIFATHINSQPTTFWRNSDTFRIPAGTNTCHVAYSDLRETLGYAAVPFIAIPARDYTIVRKREPSIAAPIKAAPHSASANAWIITDRRDRAAIHETLPDGSSRVVVETPKEDYVFGFLSPEAAIAEYRKKNP